MAKLGHTLRGAATGPLPSLAIRGGPTPGGGCTPALLGGGPLSGHRAMGHWPPTGHLLAIRGGATGHRLATYWPSGEAPHWPPTGHKGAGKELCPAIPNLRRTGPHWPPKGA